MTLLSVVIPTFNRAARICDATTAYLDVLRLAAHTSGVEIECIVVDDHSTDETFPRLREQFKDASDVRLLQLPTNSGPGPARDAGLQIAKGNWIWFLDDDDELNAVVVSALFERLHNEDGMFDVLAHSLKNTYGQSLRSNRMRIAQRILSFREHQEVFRYVIRRTLLESSAIRFSPGLHEDIRYIFEVLAAANGVGVLPEKLVIKQKSNDGITAHMSEPRVDGYIRAYNELSAALSTSDLDSPQIRRDLLDQTLGVLIYLIVSEQNDEKAMAMLGYLNQASSNKDAWGMALTEAAASEATATNFKYAGSIWREGRSDGELELLGRLRNVFQTRLSCKDLDSSVFLGPDEIRACCKRFFVNGIRKGDVVLLKADESIGLPDIQSAKDSLIARINSDSAPECSGCPYIERRPIEATGVNYISLENFSYCNMRCTYCSPKYYGGAEARYNASVIVDQLADNPSNLASNCHVVWGGGEPTLSPRFEPINNTLLGLSKIGKIRVLSNSLRYSETLAKNLQDPRFHLVTSIDAGSDELFKKIRGKGDIESVMENLSQYLQTLNDPRRLTIKYILCAENFDSKELEIFVARLVDIGLLGCMFQISCDFTTEHPIDEMVCALYELAMRLKIAGAQVVFFDDLVRDRVVIDERLASKVQNHLERLGLDCAGMLAPGSERRVVLWGNGKQAEWLLRRTASGQSGRIIGVVSNASQWESFDAGQDSNTGIYPAGVQSMYEILRNIESAGLLARVFSGVVL